MVRQRTRMVRIPLELWEQLKQLGVDDGLSGQQVVDRALARGVTATMRARQLVTDLRDFMSREGDALKEALWFDETDSVDQTHAWCDTLIEQLDDRKAWNGARAEEEEDEDDEEEDEDEIEEEA